MWGVPHVSDQVNSHGSHEWSSNPSGLGSNGPSSLWHNAPSNCFLQITPFVHIVWWSVFCNCFLGHISEWNPCFHTPRANVDKKSVVFSWLSRWHLSFLQKKLNISLTLLFPLSFWAPKFNSLYTGAREARWDRKWKCNLTGISHCKYCQLNREGFCRTK